MFHFVATIHNLTTLSLSLSLHIHFVQVTAPLVEYYEKKGVLQTFQGTMSDVIYPQLKVWLEQELVRLNDQKHEES